MRETQPLTLEQRVRRLEKRIALGSPMPSLLDLDRYEDGPTLRMMAVVGVTGLGPEVLREMIDAGDLRGVRHGRNYKVLWRSLRSYLLRTGALPLKDGER